MTKGTAYGFLTRGCCNNCSFCIVSQKEGLCVKKVADLSEWWNGQKNIVLMDANILACKDRVELLHQLIDSGAKVEFNQGLDARFIPEDIALLLKQIKTKTWHFAFDFVKNEEKVIKGLKTFVEVVEPNPRNCSVYVLTNYDTTFEEDYYRVRKIQEVGLIPDIRVYRKTSLPRRHILRDLQRWSNNRFIYQSTPCFWDYQPRVEGNMKETYTKEYERCNYGGI